MHTPYKISSGCQLKWHLRMFIKLLRHCLFSPFATAWHQEQQPYFNGYLHIPAYMEMKWPISWRKREAKSSSQNPNLVTKKQKHRNGGYNLQQDTLRLLSRHQQTMIFQLRTGHCRLCSHMKKIGIESQPFAPADWKHKPQPVFCSHALSTKEKEKAPGQQKVP